ncbi:unnamed protein product [Urochloa humidicola]
MASPRSTTSCTRVQRTRRPDARATVAAACEAAGRRGLQQELRGGGVRGRRQARLPPAGDDRGGGVSRGRPPCAIRGEGASGASHGRGRRATTEEGLRAACEAAGRRGFRQRVATVAVEGRGAAKDDLRALAAEKELRTLAMATMKEGLRAAAMVGKGRVGAPMNIALVISCCCSSDLVMLQQ